MNGQFCLSPLPGLGRFVVFDPRFHRGLLSATPPALPKDNQTRRDESEGLLSKHETGNVHAEDIYIFLHDDCLPVVQLRFCIY